MNKKLIYSLVLLSIFLLVLTACGGNTSDQATDTQPTETENSEKNEDAKSEDYPTDSIEMIVGFGAGGGTDTMARIIQPKLQEILGVPVAVRNMPGASSALALEYVNEQPANGQTILFQTDLVRVFPTMGMTDLTYKDFEQIGIGAMGVANFVVGKDSSLKTFDDLVELLKTDKAKVGVAGIGDPWHLTLEIVSNVVGGKAEVITYESGKNAVMAAIRGEVNFSISGVNEVADMLRAGEARTLAVMDNKAFDVEGFGVIPPVTDFVADLAPFVPEGTWWGPAVKAGTPQHIVDKLRTAYNQIVKTDEFKKFAEERAIVLITIEDPQDYTRQITEGTSWLLWDIGVGERSPEELGISRP